MAGALRSASGASCVGESSTPRSSSPSNRVDAGKRIHQPAFDQIHTLLQRPGRAAGVGDQAQDYIFSKKYGLDTDRQSSFQLKYTDAQSKEVTITCDCTFCNIQEWSGASTDDSAISVEIRFDGKPTITPAA